MLDRAALLALVPDEPRWVEARDLLLAGAPVTPVGDGALVVSVDDQLQVAVGPVAVAATVAAADPALPLLCAIERDDLAAALRAAGWLVERAQLHTLPDPDGLPDDDGAGLLPDDASLDHLPDELRDELQRARRHAPIHTVCVDGVPVSFAYASARTERWFDTSVDTAPGFRQLGLATLVAAALIRAERAGGREPVWGALDSNHASLRLAARLGFVPTGALWVATPA